MVNDGTAPERALHYHRIIGGAYREALTKNLTFADQNNIVQYGTDIDLHFGTMVPPNGLFLDCVSTVSTFRT